MRQRDDESGRNGPSVSATSPGAVLILNAGRGWGPELARRLAGAGLKVVLQGPGPSEGGRDLLQEILDAGGRGAAVECCSAGLGSESDVFASLQSLVGPIGAVVVNPWDSTVHEPEGGIDRRVVAAVESAHRWTRALAETHRGPAPAMIVALQHGDEVDSVDAAVHRSLWLGLIDGLRKELAGRRLEVVSIALAAPGSESRRGRDPRAAVELITEHLLRPKEQAGESGKRPAGSSRGRDRARPLVPGPVMAR